MPLLRVIPRQKKVASAAAAAAVVNEVSSESKDMTGDVKDETEVPISKEEFKTKNWCEKIMQFIHDIKKDRFNYYKMTNPD